MTTHNLQRTARREKPVLPHLPLTLEQLCAVDEVRYHLAQYAIITAERFYRAHPELHLSWDVTLTACIREVI